MIRAGILGVTGYAGIELLRLLINHPEVEVTTLVSGSTAGEKNCGSGGRDCKNDKSEYINSIECEISLGVYF